jgi:hypothetical protein
VGDGKAGAVNTPVPCFSAFSMLLGEKGGGALGIKKGVMEKPESMKNQNCNSERKLQSNAQLQP